VANRGSSDISAYSINAAGALTLVGTAAAGSLPDSVTAEPTGRFVYVSNFYSQDVSAYAITPSGSLTFVDAAVSPQGQQPSSVNAEPTGKFVYAIRYVFRNFSEIAAYAINPATGALTETISPPTPIVGANAITTTRTN
jgi:6-phosphogluconolactonase (cycloisomerase 2 family)